MSAAPFVSFKTVREAVTMEQILSHYDLLGQLTKRGEDALTGVCPIHKGTNPTQFRVSLSKNLWNCFGPCRGGNILDFVVAMESAGKKEGEKITLAEAAARIAVWFNLTGGRSGKTRREVPALRASVQGMSPTQTPSEEGGSAQGVAVAEAAAADPCKVNLPLSFTLRNLDPGHEYLERLGFTRQAMEALGVGYCSKGLMKGRIAIPIHNVHGELLAYAGRSLTDEGEGRYKYPEGFCKELELYNLHRAVSALKTNGLGLIVVRDFLDVFRFYEAGYENVVALMGATVSEAQTRLFRGVVGEGWRLSLVLSAKDEDLVEILAKLIGTFYVRLWRTAGAPATLGEDAIRQQLG